MTSSALTGNTSGLASATSPGLVGITTQTFAGVKTFQDGLAFTSASLSDVQATILGLKQYLHGTTYNGGNAPTVTCPQAGFSVVRSLFIPYQTQDGSWRLKFNIVAGITSTSLAITATITINGVTYKNVTVYYQSCSAGSAGSVLGNIQRAITNPNTSQIFLDITAGSGITNLNVSGDIELNAKPTWAY